MLWSVVILFERRVPQLQLSRKRLYPCPPDSLKGGPVLGSRPKPRDPPSPHSRIGVRVSQTAEALDRIRGDGVDGPSRAF